VRKQSVHKLKIAKEKFHASTAAPYSNAAGEDTASATEGNLNSPLDNLQAVGKRPCPENAAIATLFPVVSDN